MFGGRVIRGISYASCGGTELLTDLYLPEGGQAACPLLVFFHGGGMEWGSREELAFLAEEFAEGGIAVALPDYRLLPHVSFPAPVEDAARSVVWLKNHIHEYCSCKGLFVGGHSAGAYLAMLLCFDHSYLLKNGVDPGGLNGFVFGSGQPTTHFNILKYRGEDPRTVLIDESAPMRYIGSSGPPLQILCGERDIENRLEQTQLLVSTLRHFGYESEVDFQLFYGHDHGSYLERKEQKHSKLYEAASAFICRHC